MDCPWLQQSFLRWFGPRGQILGPRALWPQIQKSAIFSQNPTIWVSMDSPGPRESFVVFWTLGPNFGSKGLLEPNSKICTFVTKPHNMGVYGLAWTPAISFEVNRTLGAFRLQIKKSALFSLNSTIWVYGLAWPQQSVLSWFGPQIQNLQNGSLSSPLCQPSSFDIFELTFTHMGACIKIPWVAGASRGGPKGRFCELI